MKSANICKTIIDTKTAEITTETFEATTANVRCKKCGKFFDDVVFIDLPEGPDREIYLDEWICEKCYDIEGAREVKNHYKAMI